MKELTQYFLIFLSLAVATPSFASDTLYLPNLGTQAQGTDVSGQKSLNTYVTGGNLSFTEQATAAAGAGLPSVDKVIAGFDGTAVRTILTDASGNLKTSRTWSLLSGSDSVSAVQSGAWNVGRTWNLSSASDTVNAVQSGAWSVSVSNFPATQPVTGTFWQATQPVSGSVSVSNFPASQAVTGTFWQATQPVSIASMPSTPVTGTFWQATQPVSGSLSVTANVAPVNANASNANSTVTTTAATLTAPSNAVGFLLQNLGSSTANIRWQIGGAASSGSGVQLAPGQDSGFVPAGSNVSIAAESGTQNYSVQWVQK